jgi:hypothetical protein
MLYLVLTDKVATFAADAVHEGTLALRAYLGLGLVGLAASH